MEKMEIDWDVASEVATAIGADKRLTSKVISLIDDGNTLPFIARYRKEVTGNMQPDDIRRIKAQLASCREVISKIDKAFKSLNMKGALTDDLSMQLRQCKSVEEVSFFTEPFKQTGPKTLAAKARAAGLEPIALDVLKSGRCIDFSRAAAYYKVQSQTSKELEDGVSNIIADILAKDMKILRFIETHCEQIPPMLQTQPVCANKSSVCRKAGKSNNDKKISKNYEEDRKKFQRYLNFSCALDKLAPHMLLAINRAEERKIINVKLIFKDALRGHVVNFLTSLYLPLMHHSHQKFFWDAFDDSWKRLIAPHITRKLRSKATSIAHELSLGVFSDNLKRLLMTAPLRYTPTPTAGSLSYKLTVPNKQQDSLPEIVSASLGSPGDRIPVVGLDPGWRHGCKWAACDPLGSVLRCGVLHLMSVDPENLSGVKELADTMNIHGINTIALGNGQACRQTEQWLAKAVEQGVFHPLQIRYTIVSEAGASVYSASPLADKELGGMDVSLRGAVSIARRLQDPLAEMVKIDPKHLGVGMYQHDLAPKRLEEEVNELLQECISFVGVDVNTAQQHVLSRVAGLSESKAKFIIDYRSSHGRIRCRNEILKIKGIGNSTFSQCAGFLRVKPNFSNVPLDPSKDVEFVSLCSEEEDVEMEVISRKRRLRLVSDVIDPIKRKRIEPNPNELCFNPLDQTAIHPDSYDLATRLIRYLQYEISDVGCLPLRNAAKKLLDSPSCNSTLSQFQTGSFGLETICDILSALSRPIDFDERQNQFAPMFRSSIISMINLHPGLQVTGRVENVTTFGAFVDIGVENNALISCKDFPPLKTNSSLLGKTNHSGKSCINQLSLHLGDRIKATVSSLSEGKINLTNISIL